MREYAAFRARSADVTAPLRLRHLVNNWRARRAVGKLTTSDPHILRDIGLTPDDVRWASELPLSINAMWALEQRIGRREY